jgi:membrane associated rhomboid family serine protease
MALLDDIRFQFRTGNTLMQLIYINGGIFLALMVFRVILHLAGADAIYHETIRQLSLPASPVALLLRPWSVITHMFVHFDFLHVLFNMVWFYFGGTIFLQFLDGKKLLSTYVLGSLCGAVLFMLVFNLIPRYQPMAATAYAMGASAGVLAIVVAAATTAPNYVVHLVLIGPVRLKYIALISVILDVIFIPDGNAGGHFGHLGGAAFGFLFALQLKKGRALTVDFLQPFRWLKAAMPKRKPAIKVVHSKPRNDYEYNENKAARQQTVDSILDKIKQSGYESLSAREKEILFKASKDL